MKFVNDFATGSKVIRERLPALAGSQLVGDDSGWDNYAIIADNKYLFRFPRRIDSLTQIKQETEVLAQLYAKLPNDIEVPKYLATDLDGDYPFVYYEMIQGQPLTRELYAGFDAEQKERFKRQLVGFLRILHSINPESCKSLTHVDPRQKYQELYQRITQSCFKYLSPIEQDKTQRLFADYFQDYVMCNYEPVVVHGDLSENHILITERGIGIIDFGDTCVFDPAIDLSWFYLFDRELFYGLMKQYLERDDADFEKRIVDFYVPIIPYDGVMFGEETQNQILFTEELNDLKENLAKL